MEEADKMEITRVKMEIGSFLHKIEPKGTILGFSFMFTQARNEKLCLDSVSFLHKLEAKNYAWIQFRFYRSLK